MTGRINNIMTGIKQFSFIRSVYSLPTGVFCLVLTAYCLLSTAAFAADRKQLIDTIKKAVISELLRSVSPNVELGGIRNVKGFDTLDDNATYAVCSLAADGYNGRNKIVYRVALCDDGKIDHVVLVEASYDVLTDVFITAKPLGSGSIISRDDVYSVKQKSSRLPMGAVTDMNEIEGKSLKSNIAQGVIMRSDYFSNAAKSNSNRGKEVTVLVEGDNVLVSTRGVLRNDAIIGGVARVACSAQKKDINGILVSEDTVKVKI